VAGAALAAKQKLRATRLFALDADAADRESKWWLSCLRLHAAAAAGGRGARCGVGLPGRVTFFIWLASLDFDYGSAFWGAAGALDVRVCVCFGRHCHCLSRVRVHCYRHRLSLTTHFVHKPPHPAAQQSYEPPQSPASGGRATRGKTKKVKRPPPPHTTDDERRKKSNRAARFLQCCLSRAVVTVRWVR